MNRNSVPLPELKPHLGDSFEQDASEVQVTVSFGPRRRRPWIAAAALAGVAAGILVAVAISDWNGTRAGSPPAPGASRSQLPGAAGVAAAYRYPLHCLSVVTAASDPTYARAELDRASPCWRYGGYVTAIFHRAGGAWRLVLDAGSYTCPLASLPAVVQAQLALCPPGAGAS